MAKPKTMTLEEFLAWEHDQKEKHEYFRGHVYVHPMRVAMPGGSPNHNEIEANLIVAVANALESTSYRTLTSSQMVVTEEGDAAYYPDVTVLDGPRDIRKYRKNNAAANAVAVFEVASPSTERYDRGRKLESYKSIPTMCEIVLVQAIEARIERFVRHENAWIHEMYEGLESDLPVLGALIPLKRIYRNVDVPPFSLGIDIDDTTDEE